MIAEGKQARDRLYAYADNPSQKKVYLILENMLLQPDCTNIYLSTWNTIQVESFMNELTKQDIKLQSKEERSKVTEAVITYGCLLAAYTTQMIRQRLQINNNSKKRYGPPTMKQALYEQRYSNTWIDYEKRLHQLHKKKKKHKISPKQLLINEKKFNFVKSKNKLREHGNKYQNPILTCENYKPLV